MLLVTRDRDLLGVMPWVAGTVIHVPVVEQAHRFLAGRSATTSAVPVLLAYGPDTVADGRAGALIGRCPGVVASVVVCTDAQLDDLTVGGLTRLDVTDVLPLPMALDWLHERLGLYPQALHPPHSDC